MNKEELLAFEKKIIGIYETGRIRAPIHLSGGNEDILIKIFEKIKKDDWIFSTYRNHYHALLKGISPDWLCDEIINRKSIHIINADHKFYSSGMVGGMIPIALGVAVGLKLKKKDEHVWVFVGDMAAESGSFHEATKYARRHNLPMTFIIEDNEYCVFTPTQEVWGTEAGNDNIIRYKYEKTYPHHGHGKRVEF